MTLKVRMLPYLTTLFIVLAVVVAVPGPPPRRDNPPPGSRQPLTRPAPPRPPPPPPHRRTRAVNPIDDTFDIKQPKQPIGTQTPPLGIAGVRPIPLNPGPDGKRPIRSPQRYTDRPRPPFGSNGGPPGPGHVYPQPPPVRPSPPRPPVRPEPGRPNNGYRPLPPPQRPPPGRPQQPRPPVRPNPGRPQN